MTRFAPLFVLAFTSPVWADDAPQTPPPSAYEAVMNAQYAAKQPPLPASAAEAQRIYDIYLNSIGKPLKDGAADSTDSGSNAGTSPR